MRVHTPTIIAIFGATGDLAKRKLYRALFSLFRQGVLPKKLQIVGFAKQALKDREFQDIIVRSCGGRARAFARKAKYQVGFFEDLDAYRNLGDILRAWDKKFQTCSNKLFHLAVPPKYYKTIFENLAASGLTIPCSGREGWTRVLVEKPFGHNIRAAGELDELLSKLFQEQQIFRIDHYLARETVQNILTFRFSNAIFEPLWNNKYIDRVEIKLLEKIGVGERGTFYDEIGALRDVGQNHLLQMLALIAMEHPQRFDTERIRRERAKILEVLRPIPEEEVSKWTVRGQYTGYRSLKGVKKTSTTETYFKIKAFFGNARWEGTPFYLESGKGLKENLVEINIYFKEVTPCFCPPPHENHRHQNKLSFMVKPREGIAIRFWIKRLGLVNMIDPKNLSFAYPRPSPLYETQAEAYEKVLFDCIGGEQMLFASTEEVRAAWDFIMPILRGWEKNNAPLMRYTQGSEVKAL